MKTYLNDTQRVEMVLPALMMLTVMMAGANCADPGPMPVARNREEAAKLPMTIMKWRQAWAAHDKRLTSDPQFALAYEEFSRVKALFQQAMDEPTQDLYPVSKRASVLRRVANLHNDIIEPYIIERDGEDKTDPRKIGLMAYYIIQTLVDQEYLIIPPESAFGQALDALLPGLGPWEGSTPKELEDFERINASALKHYKSIFKGLKQKKYYLGLVVPN